MAITAWEQDIVFVEKFKRPTCWLASNSPHDGMKIFIEGDDLWWWEWDGGSLAKAAGVAIVRNDQVIWKDTLIQS